MRKRWLGVAGLAIVSIGVGAALWTFSSNDSAQDVNPEPASSASDYASRLLDELRRDLSLRGRAVVVAAGVSYLRINTLLLPMAAIAMVANGALRGAGDTLPAMFSTLLTRGAASVALAWFFASSPCPTATSIRGSRRSLLHAETRRWLVCTITPRIRRASMATPALVTTCPGSLASGLKKRRRCSRSTSPAAQATS